MIKKINQSKELLSNLSFCVFDLETTGGNNKTDKIIEIGLVKIEGLKVIKHKDFLINPEIKIPEFIQGLTSIKEKDVKNAPVIEDVIDEILDFMGDSILVAHNAAFDIPFFNSVLTRLEKPELKNSGLCTYLMTKYLIPNLLNSNLNYMSQIFNIKHNKAHRALDDAIATAELLLKFLNVFIDKKINKVNHLYYPRSRYELDRINFKKNDDDVTSIIKKMASIKENHFVTIKGDNGIILLALPCSGKSFERGLVAEALKKVKWTIVTIRLIGSFYEALSLFNNFYNKLDVGVQNKTMMLLRKNYLRGEEYKSNFDNKFIIHNHLVPEQYIISSTSTPNSKFKLIFRYPGHKKKLLQFIKSKSSKGSVNKITKSPYTSELKLFIDEYLASESDKDKKYLIFDKDFAFSNPDLFESTIEKHIEVNPHKSKYPEKYI